jgi:hypothetical protein
MASTQHPTTTAMRKYMLNACTAHSQTVSGKTIFKMKKLNLIPLCLSFLLISCTNLENAKLGQDPVVKKTFSSDEIQYLEKILVLYQEKILTEYPEEGNFVQAYRKYLNQLCEYGTVVEAFKKAEINEDNFKEIYDVLLESGLYDSFYPADTIFVDPTTGSKSNFMRSDSIFKISHTIPQFGKYAEFQKSCLLSIQYMSIIKIHYWDLEEHHHRI